MRRLAALILLTACAPTQAVRDDALTYRNAAYTVVTLNPAQEQLRLYWQDAQGQPYGTVAALKAELTRRGERLLFATNSGIYAPGFRPLGLHVEAGRTLVPLNRARSGGNFALLPNGVFWLDGAQAGVMESRAFERSGRRPRYATQSGPLLVQHGRLHPEFRAGSQSLKLRSGVGVCAGGTVKFVLSEAPVNFHDFAVFFRDRLGCPDALYLDGSISTIYTPERGDRQLVGYAGIWAVTAR
ncbi:phosphodiester glycosidase family protein [Deinococcus sonorensis]|uniref:Phosphodiester glycosidase family protein n=2 Tax=Deinococcus sonorensis TaxID=309891 RepID=A0AAU7U858_9DEIO